MGRLDGVGRGRLLLAGAIAPLALASAAQAQERPASSGVTAELGEVVVTARKRAESLHDAPLTVSVVDGDALQDIPLASAQDLNGVVPGLAMQTGTGAVTSPTFRGLGSNSALYSVESSVALFIDGVYMGHPRAYATPLYDVERIEMIKGTQATLLGRNTSVGAISQVTRRPSREFGYLLSGLVEFERSSARVEGVVNAPLGDTLSVRVAALYDRDGGYMENAFTGDGEGRTENVSGRLAVRWTPNDAFDLDASYQHDHRIQWGQYFEVLRDATAGATLAGRAAQIGQTNFEPVGDHRNASASFGLGAAPPGPPVKDTQVGDRANLIANWRLGDFTLTSQSAFVSYYVDRASDIDFLSAHILDFIDNEKDRQFSQEVRLASDAGERFSYVVGAYYLREAWTLNRVLAGFSPSPGVFPLTGSATQFFTQKTRAASAFGHADFRVTDRLTLSAGVRYGWEKKRGLYFRPPGPGVLGLSFPAIPRTELGLSNDVVDGDVGLQFRPDDDLMIYGTWSKGSKSAGLQNMPTTLAAAAYTGESAYTIEAGVKKRFAGLGEISVAVFDTQVKDYQFTRIALVGGVNQTVVANVDIESRGIEVNSTWRPEGLPRLNLGFVYADAKAKETVPEPPAVAAIVDGLRLPRAPKLTGNVSLDEEIPLSGDLSARLHGDVQYSSAMYLQPDFGASLDAPRRKAYAQVNLRAALVNDGAGWEVAIIGRNVANAKTPIFATPIPGTGINGTNTIAYAGTMLAPRTIALQLTLRR